MITTVTDATHRGAPQQSRFGSCGEALEQMKLDSIWHEVDPDYSPRLSVLEGAHKLPPAVKILGSKT